MHFTKWRLDRVIKGAVVLMPDGNGIPGCVEVGDTNSDGTVTVSAVTNPPAPVPERFIMPGDAVVLTP